MPFQVTELGGLAVAFSPTTTKQVERELARLDPGLFLDPELEPHGPRGPYVYLTVKHHIGHGHPPVPVLEWRDHRGPWPASMAIVEHVRRREGGLDRAFERAAAANEKKRADTIRTVGEQTYDVALDARKAAGKTSAVLPRSQALRRSRDKARARGRNV